MFGVQELTAYITAAAKRNPPVAYVIKSGGEVDKLLRQAFADHPKMQAIIQQADGLRPEGIIVFGYEDKTSIQPIISKLGALSGLLGFEYASIELKDGRTLYCMSHNTARSFLPQPEAGYMHERSPKRDTFDTVLIEALQALIAAKDEMPKAKPKHLQPTPKHGRVFFALPAEGSQKI